MIETDPPAGSRLDKDALVTVVVSQGPAEVALGRVVDLPADQVRELLAQNVISTRTDAEFFTDAPAGTVVGMRIHPRGGGDDIVCDEGCTARQADEATLFVSRGPVPDVAGDSVDGARSELGGVQLAVADQVIEQTSDTYADGEVIGIAERDGGGWWQPGDTVTLIVSTGPPLFEIPNVVGQTRDGAIAALEDAGFQVDYAVFFAAIPDSLTEVVSMDPGAGEFVVRGTRIYIQLTVTG